MAESRKSSSRYPRNSFINLLIVTFFVLFVVVAAYPLGNNRTPNGILGSFDSTGAAIILVGMPYLLMRSVNYF